MALRTAFLFAFSSSWDHVSVSGTDTPPPGPRCVPGTPIEKESGLAPTCDRFVEHDASCTAEGGGETWDLRANFHPGSICHGENDPNGLVYYKGVYHLFFQDHVGGGTVGGHMATKDFVNWKRLSIGIWNDRWYDKSAVWTFSATMVDGVPVMVYPGIATPNASSACSGNDCMTHSIALPADPSDPWLVDWVKPDYNPIITGTNRDPTTAWRTAAGEWRYTGVTRDIYSSWDFKSWRIVGNMASFSGGECPDLFPLPRDCDGCTGGQDEQRPTHVHATVSYVLGTYEDGAPNTTGIWTPIRSDYKVPMDVNDPKFFYAAKSFYDPVKDRRIVWGWIQMASELDPTPSGFRAGQCAGVGEVMTNSNSLPREVRYDPLLQRLTFFPIDEISRLRGDVLAQVGQTNIDGKFKVPVPGRKAAQSEIRVSFHVPEKRQRLSVHVMTGRYENGSDFGVELFVDFTPNALDGDAWRVSAGFDSSSLRCPVNPKDGKDTQPCPSGRSELLLKKTDKSIDIAIWVDNVFMEVFFMGGRTPATIALPCDAISSGQGVEVSSDDKAVLQSATVTEMKSIVYEDEGPSQESLIELII